MTHAAEHGIVASKPCCHPERARFLCERRTRARAAQSARLARFLNSAYDLMLEHRTRPPRANQAHQVQGRSLAPAAVNHITLRNCHPERGASSFAERGTRARRANAARLVRGNKSHAWRASKLA